MNNCCVVSAICDQIVKICESIKLLSNDEHCSTGIQTADELSDIKFMHLENMQRMTLMLTKLIAENDSMGVEELE